MMTSHGQSTSSDDSTNAPESAKAEENSIDVEGSGVDAVAASLARSAEAYKEGEPVRRAVKVSSLAALKDAAERARRK